MSAAELGRRLQALGYTSSRVIELAGEPVIMLDPITAGVLVTEIQAGRRLAAAIPEIMVTGRRVGKTELAEAWQAHRELAETLGPM